MGSRRPAGLLSDDSAAVYVVEWDRDGRDDLAAVLDRGGLRNRVATVAPDRVSELSSSNPGGVVCHWPEDDPVAGVDPQPDGGTADRGVRSVLERVVATGVECPVAVVGGGVDAAAAYEAGATDVVPLRVEDHPDVVADRLGAVFDRARSDRLLTDLFDETTDGMLVHDPETGEIVACNERFYSMLGYDPETREITLSDITDHDDEFTRERAVSRIRAAAEGESSTFEWKDPTRDGEDIWVEVKLEGATLAGNEYVVASVRDIGTRKERERHLRDNRETLRRLHDITADPDLSFDERVARLLEFGAGELGMDVGFLSRIDQEAGSFEVVDARGDHPLIQAGAQSALEETYCRRVAQGDGDDPVAIPDAQSAGMADDPAYEKFGLECYLGAEIVVNGELYGTLCFADDTPRRDPFSDTERAIIDHMAQWLVQELQNRAYVRELEESQAAQRRMVERIDDAFFAVDTDWRVQYVNDAGAAVLREAMDASYDEDDLVGRHLWEEIPDAVDTEFYDRYHQAMDEQRSVTFEARYDPLDVWFEVRAYPDADGLSVYFTDVTDRKEREQELERYETILESLDDAVYAIDDEGTITYVNEEYASMKGVDRETLLGTDITDWVDDETAERAAAARRQLEDGADVNGLEYEFQSVDGETTPVELRFASVGDPAEADGGVGVIRDVSERKARERELYIRKRALEEASIPLTLSDPSREDNPLVYVNRAFEELTGYDGEEVVGRNCRFLQGPDTDPETVDDIRASVAAEERTTTEIRNYRADGTPFDNWLSITPIYDEDGTLLRYLGSQRDVTERNRNRRIRNQLLSTTRELMSATSREEIAEVVSEATTSILEYDVNAVYLRADDGEDPSLAAAAWSTRVGEMLDDSVPPDPIAPVREAFESGETVRWTDPDAGSEGSTGKYGAVASLLAVPLGEHGVLAVGRTDCDAFGDTETTRARLLTLNATAAFDRMDRRQELQQYETVFETVRDKLYVIDRDGYIQMVSQSLAESLGYEPEQLHGEHVSSVLSEATTRQGEARILDLLVTPDAVSSTFEGRIETRDGEWIPVEIELSLLPHDDEFRGTVGAVRDISERRQREEELRVFRQALTEAGIGLAMYDDDGRFEYVNDHYAQLLGRDRERLEQSPVWEPFESVDEASFDSYWASFATGETRTEETRHRRDDGSTVPVETVTTAVDVDGRGHHILTVREITQRRERRQQSEVLNRLIRHNLRNDLTVILGHSGMLEDDLEGDPVEVAETIHETADRLRSLADSAQEAQKIIDSDTVRKPTDVVPVLEDEIDRLQGEFEVTVHRDLPEAQHVLADPTLARAVRHVLTNAVEHADDGAPTIRVGAGPATDRSGWVDIEIADDGPGIPETEVATRTAGEETSLQHGSGIGLWIVHWIVTRYGGELEFERPDDGGTLVRLKLPAADRPDPAGEDAAPPPDGGGQ